MTKIEGSEIAAAACSSMIAGGLTYWVSRAKFNYALPRALISGGCVAGVAMGVGVLGGAIYRMLQNTMRLEGPFIFRTFRELCEGDIAWARSLGVVEPELEGRIRSALNEGDMEEMAISRFRLLLLAAQEADWEGINRSLLMSADTNHIVEMRALGYFPDIMMAITRSELRHVVANHYPEAQQAKLRASLRTFIWWCGDFGIEFSEMVSQEIDDALQECNWDDVNNFLVRYDAVTNHLSRILAPTIDAESAMECLCRFRVDLLKAVLEERGYSVYVEGYDFESGTCFVIGQLNGPGPRRHMIEARSAMSETVIRDILAQHPPLN